VLSIIMLAGNHALGTCRNYTILQLITTRCCCNR